MSAATVRACLAATVFVALLAGLSVALAGALHPVVGWALPTVVAGVVAWRLVDRLLDEQAIVRDQARHRGGSEPLTLPPNFTP